MSQQPLNLEPNRRTCDLCNGLGRIVYNHSSAPCARCSGSGVIPITREVPVACPACRGMGTNSLGRGCELCDASGEVSTETWVRYQAGQSQEPAPVRREYDCPICTGRGTNEQYAACIACAGRGRVRSIDELFCPLCRGQRAGRCRVCNAQGRVTHQQWNDYQANVNSQIQTATTPSLPIEDVSPGHATMPDTNMELMRHDTEGRFAFNWDNIAAVVNNEGAAPPGDVVNLQYRYNFFLASDEAPFETVLSLTDPQSQGSRDVSMSLSSDDESVLFDYMVREVDRRAQQARHDLLRSLREIDYCRRMKAALDTRPEPQKQYEIVDNTVYELGRAPRPAPPAPPSSAHRAHRTINM